MAINQKPETLLEANSSDLPSGLDVLTEDQERANLSRDEIFKRHPSMSMIAQILTDFIVTNSKASSHDDFTVSLLDRKGVSGLAFGGTPMQDGSIRKGAYKALKEAFDSFEDTANRHGLEQSNDITLLKENFFIGAAADKLGLLAFLKALARDEGIAIGPDIEGKRRPSIGVFTLDDIEDALKAEHEAFLQASLTQQFGEAGDNPDSLDDEVRSWYELIGPLNEALTRGLGTTNFKGNFFKTKHGHALYIHAEEPDEDIEDKIDEVLAKLEEAGAIEGVKINREMSAFALNGRDSLERLLARALDLYPEPEKNVEVNAKPLFWPRGYPKTPADMVSLALYGLGRIHYDMDDHIHWTVEESSDGYYRFTAAAADQETMDSVRPLIEDMLIDMEKDGGDWDGINILPLTGMIEISSITTFAQLLEKYAQERIIYFGEQALKICEAASYNDDGELVVYEEDITEALSDDELCDAQMAIEPPAEGDKNNEPEDDDYYELKPDPTILNMLGHRQYGSHDELYRDVARIMRLLDSDFYGGPYGPAEILKMVKDQQKPKTEPIPAPGLH